VLRTLLNYFPGPFAGCLLRFIKEAINLALNSLARHNAAIIAPVERRVKERIRSEVSRRLR
jgi:hypothetical protein